jgi:hypothetical protein
VKYTRKIKIVVEDALLVASHIPVACGGPAASELGPKIILVIHFVRIGSV